MARQQGRKARILIVDDHPMMREGLAGLIDLQPDLEVCAEAANGSEALAAARDLGPDLAIVDLSLEGESGISLIKKIRAQHSDMPILVFSMHRESAYVERSLRAGATGYVTKGQSPAIVIEAARRLLDGGVFVSDDLASVMLRTFTAPGNRNAGSPIELLSDREFEVFHLIGQGLTSRAISEALHVGIKTINTHREGIKRKLGLRNAADLARAALRWEQVQAEE
jgi:DNA-binding NarL/FixJ family response regulator